MKRIALRLPDWVWTGGVNYVETVCRALLAHPELDYEPVVLCSPRAEAQVQSRFAALLGAGLIRDPYLARGRRTGLLGAVALGCNRHMRALCERHHCDVVMEAADFYGWRFPFACLAWVPDFQDRHLPTLFSRRARYQKALGLRLQLAAGRVVLLSSEDARRDCEAFYPQAQGRTAVARFAVQPALDPGEEQPQVGARYRLPSRFFYMPNQFWAHKNHFAVVEALRLLRARGADVVVATSGSPQEPRQVGYFERLRAKVAAGDVSDTFLFLGDVPRRDVALLMRASVAMLNASLFEGWSTTVEEAKSLGVRMVLSDLAVHREQVGAAADFFDPHEPQAIAACLQRVWCDLAPPPTLSDQQAAAAAATLRIQEFAEQFTRACDQARGRPAIPPPPPPPLPGQAERLALTAPRTTASGRRARVLFIEQFYYPDGWGGAELPVDVTVHLARRGFAVEVICGSDQYAPLEGEAPTDPRSRGVRIRRIPSLMRGSIHRWKLARQLWFYLALLPLLLLRRPPDVFVAQTNPPLAVILVVAVARLWRRPAVIIAMDVYPEVLIAHGVMRGENLLGQALERLFGWAYRHAQRIVALGPVMRERLQAKGALGGRIVEIPNWATGAPGRLTGADNTLRAEWGLEDKFVLLYSGNLGLAHEFDTLLEGVRLALRSAPSLRLIFIGRGSRLAEVKRRVAELQLENVVRFSDLLPAQRLPESFGIAHLAVVTLQPGFAGLVVPSKLQGYLARGIPVLYIGPDSDIDRYVTRSGGGICRRCDDAQGVAVLLVELAADRERLSGLGTEGRAFYEAQFAKARGLERYEALISSLLNPSAAPR